MTSRETSIDPWREGSPTVASPATRRALELPELLSLLSCRAASDLGNERISELRPFADEASLSSHRQRFEEAERLLANQSLVPFRESPMLHLLTELEAGGGNLDGKDLVSLRDLLEISSQAIRRIAAADPPCEALTEQTEQVPQLSELLAKLRRTFDARGDVREEATPTLSRLRGRIRSVRSTIYQDLSGFVEGAREHLSEETIPLRGGRLVLVLQSGARGRIPGLIHGRSGSGKSFYFEPLEAVEGNNRLQQAVEEEEAERRRIIAELIRSAVEQLPAIGAHAQLVGELDMLQAMASFRRESQGHLADLGEGGEIRLTSARHPLLDPNLADLRKEALGTAGHEGEIIPLDLYLSRKEHALVVTGPNAGGKTVALKTLGLLTLAHLCGLPIPAAKGSRIPFLEAVVATVGDEQDLLADRSTFSGRLLRLREAWESAGPRSLILIDELGSGTDPEEGAALAVALLEGLVGSRSLALITTHLSPLAAAALEHPGAACAAMQFDSSSGAPTYTLLPGPPGGSEALALARRLQLPAPWLDRAEELLGPEHRDLRRLLAEVERARDELAASQQSLRQELADAERLRQRLAEREQELLSEKKSLAKEMRRQLDSFRAETSLSLQKEVERLSSQLAKGRRKNLAGEATRRLFDKAPALPVEAEEGLPPSLGARVRHRQLRWEGVLERLDRGKAAVRVRGKIFRCQETDLVGLEATEPGGKGGTKTKNKSRHPQRRAPGPGLEDASPAAELKLIGLRAEEALEALDSFLDRSILGSHGQLRIIHGHGTGRLRQAVREHLRRHPAVASQRPGKGNEGGNGATIVALKGS